MLQSFPEEDQVTIPAATTTETLNVEADVSTREDISSYYDALLNQAPKGLCGCLERIPMVIKMAAMLLLSTAAIVLFSIGIVWEAGLQVRVTLPCNYIIVGSGTKKSSQRSENGHTGCNLYSRHSTRTSLWHLDVCKKIVQKFTNLLVTLLVVRPIFNATIQVWQLPMRIGRRL